MIEVAHLMVQFSHGSLHMFICCVHGEFQLFNFMDLFTEDHRKLLLRRDIFLVTGYHKLLKSRHPPRTNRLIRLNLVSQVRYRFHVDD